MAGQGGGVRGTSRGGRRSQNLMGDTAVPWSCRSAQQHPERQPGGAELDC